MVIKTFKNGKRIICYITKTKQSNVDGFRVCTGKPSDINCISWFYDNLINAQFTANEYFNNRTNFLK